MNKFNKEERLCSKKSLDLLFKNGSSFLLYPFRITFLFVEEPHKYPAQVVINVAKKRYKHAVDRNLIKRRTREAYRLHKEPHLYTALANSNNLLLLSLQFVGKEKYEFAFFEKKLIASFKKLITQIGNHENN
ncbi:ribonuclease P protein component [Pedobacter boryungensis]|uniref:Ribonuclease P protein component n=1 Tax=Pedobacter boryungensis TaxID=869962 RepID=A0ABX2DAX0_9SPHI|nr:ribonuclease P protein component [Pedobacter boryungensis]NQX31182.1 ribonuclease P protein component [Pedobacter boryungensis]